MKRTGLMNARPHPDPLPRGGGITIPCTSFCGRAFDKSSSAVFGAAADLAPSPRGEGQGGGGLESCLNFQIA